MPTSADSEDGDRSRKKSPACRPSRLSEPEPSGQLPTARDHRAFRSDGSDPEAEPDGEEGHPADARELEALAQTTSIPELDADALLGVAIRRRALDDEIDRLASRVVEKLSDRIVREIAWEVIPDMAEIVIKQRIKELESGVE